MHLNSDISSALQHIEAIKKVIDDSDDAKLQLSTGDSLKLILGLLQDPVLRSIVQVQDSLTDLNKQIVQHPSILPSDFDINPSGDLVLNVPPSLDLYDADYPDEQRVPSAQLSPRSPNSPSGTSIGYSSHTTAMLPPSADEDIMLEEQHLNMLKKTRGYSDLARSDDERPQSAVSDSSKHVIDIMAAEWAQIQSLELINDGTGLGFGIIGARTSGVIVKTILPGGVADRDGRLISGDHILQIGDVNLHDMVSEQVASVLRQSGTHVRLVVARPVDPVKTAQDIDGTAIVPARLLSDPNELERYLIAAGYPDIFSISSTPSTPTPAMQDDFNFHEIQAIANRPPLSPPSDLDLPETERFNVELTKDANGLGITIAGYVCEKEELSGIFVKSVSAGSAADLSGRIQVNDRIIEVDQQSLQGYSNHQAVEVLKKSGLIVNLCLERYLRGPKYDQLQQAIAANEMKPSSTTPTAGPSPTAMATIRPHSGMSLTHQSHDLIRRASINDPSYHTADPTDVNLQYMRSLERSSVHSTPSKATPIAVVSGSSRKLALARDSIENKIANESIESNSFADDDGACVGGPGGKSVSVVQAINTATTNRHKYWVEPILTEEIENSIRNRWRAVMEQDTHIIVAQIRKFAASSGLGISLEGTVDVEGGVELRPHHYIRSILPEGPVGQNKLLRSGDELLEVNGQRLLGMNHLEVVSILKELPQDVRMVCARGEVEQLIPFTEENIRKSLGLNFGGSQNLENLIPASDRLVKAKSDGSLATSGGAAEDTFNKLKSRSLEPLTGLAMWSSEPQIIELVKGERGLGFSILDYQDPLDANDTLIVIRSLVPGGVAQLDGRLIPGDRLLFVNDINLENSSLDQAVQALKGAPKGVVRIGVAKPLPMADTLAQNISEMNISNSASNNSNSGNGGYNNTNYFSNYQEQQQQHRYKNGNNHMHHSSIDPDVIPEWKSK